MPSASAIEDSDQVDRQPEFVVLLLEHQVQRVEHRAGDVPVVVVRLQVQRVGVGEEPTELRGDLEAGLLGDADVDEGLGGVGHDRSFPAARCRRRPMGRHPRYGLVPGSRSSTRQISTARRSGHLWSDRCASSTAPPS
jgi:hypothetical protein